MKIKINLDFFRRHYQIACVLAALIALGCGKEEDPVNPSNRLCQGEAGFGARVVGRAEPVDVCLDDADVTTLYTVVPGRYYVTARSTQGGTTFELQMTFNESGTQASLTPTGVPSDVDTQPDAVWIYYAEIPAQGSAIESDAVTGGVFTLGFGDDTAVAGQFSSITLDMIDRATSLKVGERIISEGFFSLLTD